MPPLRCFIPAQGLQPRAAGMIADTQTQAHRQAVAGATASVNRHQRMPIRLHRRSSGASRPPGTAVCNAAVAARSSAGGGRPAHSRQTPHTDAAGGFGTAGTLNSNQPTRRLSHISPSTRCRTASDAAEHPANCARLCRGSARRAAGLDQRDTCSTHHQSPDDSGQARRGAHVGSR